MRSVGTREDAAWSVGLLASVVVFVAGVYGLGRDNDIVHSYDVREVVSYARAFQRAALLEGRLPLWMPHVFSGWPFAANPQTQTFYPATLATLVLSQPTLMTLDLIVHLWVAAVGTCLLLTRVFGLRPGPAAFGGMVFALSGRFVGHAYAGHPPFWAAAAYVPLVLLATDQAVRQDTRAAPWLWIGALLIGLQILSGGLPLVWLTWLFVALYRIGDTLRRAATSWRAWRDELLVLGVMLALGTAVAAVQVLPASELLPLSTRAGTAYEYAVAGSFPPALLPTLLFARAGDPRQAYFWEYYAYVGWVPLALAVVGLTQARRERRIIVLVVVAALAVLFMLGGYGVLFPVLWTHVPGFNLFRAPARAALVLDLVIAIVAAIGLHRLGRGRFATALVVVAGLVTFVDVALSARANRGRLFVPDDRLVESTRHRQLSQMLQADGSWYRFWFPPALLRQNHACQLGARSVGGYDALYLARYNRFVYAMTDTPPPPHLVTILSARTFLNTPDPFPFKILGVKYASYQGRIRTQSAPIRRAWFVTRTRRVEDEASALAYMRGDRFAPHSEAIFEAPEADALGLPAADGTPPDDSSPSITVEDLSPEHLRIHIGPHPPGYLVLSEIFYPGWRATAGGRELPVYRADSILRSVPLAPGQDEIDLVFSPSSLRYGTLISAAALLVASAGLWAAWTRSRRGI